MEVKVKRLTKELKVISAWQNSFFNKSNAEIGASTVNCKHRTEMAMLKSCLCYLMHLVTLNNFVIHGVLSKIDIMVTLKHRILINDGLIIYYFNLYGQTCFAENVIYVYIIQKECYKRLFIVSYFHGWQYLGRPLCIPISVERNYTYFDFCERLPCQDEHL